MLFATLPSYDNVFCVMFIKKFLDNSYYTREIFQRVYSVLTHSAMQSKAKQSKANPSDVQLTMHHHSTVGSCMWFLCFMALKKFSIFVSRDVMEKNNKRKNCEPHERFETGTIFFGCWHTFFVYSVSVKSKKVWLCACDICIYHSMCLSVLPVSVFCGNMKTGFANQ